MERLQYQARLADRQFQRSDPDNRLVTGELERRWEEALRACKEAEERLREEQAHASCLAIPADLLEQLKDFCLRAPKISPPPFGDQGAHWRPWTPAREARPGRVGGWRDAFNCGSAR